MPRKFQKSILIFRSLGWRAPAPRPLLFLEILMDILQQWACKLCTGEVKQSLLFDSKMCDTITLDPSFQTFACRLARVV
jgi:hypothetical protein